MRMTAKGLLSTEVFLHIGACIEFVVNKGVCGSKGFDVPFAAVNFTY